MPPEETRHLRRRLEMTLRILRQKPASFSDRLLFANAGENILQRAPFGSMIENVVGRDDRDTDPAGDPRQRLDPRPVIATIEMRDSKIERPCPERLAHPAELGFETFGPRTFPLTARKSSFASRSHHLPFRDSSRRKRDHLSRAFRRCPSPFLLAFLAQNLPPTPCLRHQRDEHLSLGGRRHIRQVEFARPLGAAPLSKRQKPRQATISSTILWKAQKTRGILQIETRPDDELHASLLRRRMRTHHAGKRVAIGNGDRIEAERLGPLDQLMCMRPAIEEREVSDNLQLGISLALLHLETLPSHQNIPCRNQTGISRAALGSPVSSSPPLPAAASSAPYNPAR